MTQLKLSDCTPDQFELIIYRAMRKAIVDAETGYPPECHLHISKGDVEDADLPRPVAKRRPGATAIPRLPINDILHF